MSFIPANNQILVTKSDPKANISTVQTLSLDPVCFIATDQDELEFL